MTETRPIAGVFLVAALAASGCAGQASRQLHAKVGVSAPPRVLALTEVGPVSLRGIAMSGPGEVWVSGTDGSIFRIRRHGRQAKLRAPRGAEELDFRDLEWLGPGRLLAMSAGPGDRSRIYKTEDDGRSWRLTYRNEDPDRFFNSFAFWDDRRGLLISDSGDDRLVLLRTDDAGESWTRVGMESLPLLVPGEAGFAASGTAVATQPGGRVWVASGGTAARVFRSNDFGETWQVAETPLVRGRPGSGIFSIAFRDPLHGVIVGGDYQDPTLDSGNAAWTEDGGATWRASAIEAADGLSHKACAIDLGDGGYLAAGRLGLAYSDDDGRSWRELPGPPYYTGIFDRESGFGYLAGANGRVGRWIMPSRPDRE